MTKKAMCINCGERETYDDITNLCNECYIDEAESEIR